MPTGEGEEQGRKRTPVYRHQGHILAHIIAATDHGVFFFGPGGLEQFRGTSPCMYGMCCYVLLLLGSITFFFPFFFRCQRANYPRTMKERRGRKAPQKKSSSLLLSFFLP